MKKSIQTDYSNHKLNDCSQGTLLYYDDAYDLEIYCQTYRYYLIAVFNYDYIEQKLHSSDYYLKNSSNIPYKDKLEYTNKVDSYLTDFVASIDNLGVVANKEKKTQKEATNAIAK